MSIYYTRIIPSKSKKEHLIDLINNIDYAELYGVYTDETNFSGAIKRSLNKGAQHISKDFINTINKMKK